MINGYKFSFWSSAVINLWFITYNFYYAFQKPVKLCNNLVLLLRCSKLYFFFCFCHICLRHICLHYLILYLFLFCTDVHLSHTCEIDAVSRNVFIFATNFHSGTKMSTFKWPSVTGTSHNMKDFIHEILQNLTPVSNTIDLCWMCVKNSSCQKKKLLCSSIHASSTSVHHKLMLICRWWLQDHMSEISIGRRHVCHRIASLKYNAHGQTTRTRTTTCALFGSQQVAFWCVIA